MKNKKLRRKVLAGSIPAGLPERTKLDRVDVSDC